jgi:hypothetical protein
MKCVLAVIILIVQFSAASGRAQTSGETRPVAAPQPAGSVASPSPSAEATSMPPSLDIILTEVQQAAQSANVDIARLKIDKWKGDSTERAQQQQVADSLHKNIAYAIPDLISDVRSSHGSVSSTFKLYHNINVVYEYLSQLTDAAAGMGKKEEFEPLNNDAAALDRARQHLSSYIEQAAASLENKVRTAVVAATPTPVPQAPPKKIVVDDDTSHKKPVTTKKQKTSSPPAKPSPTPN